MIAPINSHLSHEFNSPPGEVKAYRVQVGHASVTVHGRTVEDAIREARRRLCEEMPRMWDMIYNLDVSRFQVVPA